MIGAEGAVEALKDLLEARFPAKAAEIEERLGLEEGAIGSPAMISTEDRPQLAIEDWPAIMLVPQDVTETRRIDVLDTGAEVYEMTYRLRAFLYARAEGYAEVSRLTRRLMLAQREILFAEKDLGGAIPARLEPSSYRESYSDLVLDRSGRSIAAAFAEVEVKIEETVTVSDRVTASDAIVTGAGPHPALD